MKMPRVFRKGLFTAFAGFWRREVGPRKRDIFLTQDFSFAVLLAVAMAWWGPSTLTGAPKAADFATGFIAYAAIALGFCVGGMTIALTLPDRAFVEKLAKLEIEGKAGNALSGLLFVFTWTAVIHWLAIVSLIVALVFDGGDPRTFVADHGVGRRVIIGAVSFLCAYALLRFLITVLTLAHVGLHYINQLRITEDKSSPDSRTGAQ